MLIDFQKAITDLKGEPIILNKTDQDAGTVFTLLAVCQEALMAGFPDEKDLAGAEKVKRFVLALKIESQIPVELKIEEIAELKKLVGKAYGPLVVGRAFELLEGTNS